ncbi:MAG: mechanosensitive ion channel domain-containing protein, partial [Candidatus Altiarchaeota archaeon]
MKLRMNLESERRIFENYLEKIGKLQSKVIVISLITVILLGLIHLGVNVNVLSLTPAQISSLSRIMLSIVVIIVATIFLKLSTPLVNKFFFFLDSPSRSILLKAWNYGVWVTAIIIILAQFTGHIQSLGISIGVFSAGLAIALQQPITSIVGWLVILARRPYKIGDRIVVRGIKGDVVEITMFYTVVREFGRDMSSDDPTGVKITIPNNIILMEPILNYTSDFPFIWDFVPVSVTYESDIKLARELVKTAAKNVLGDTMEKAVARMRP